MKPHFVLTAASAAACVLALAQPASSVPEPWFVSGKSPEMYRAGVDLDGSASGNRGAKYLRMVSGDGTSFGTLMQQFSAENYRGKRLRLQADVMTHAVSGYAGLWMRVDTPRKHSASFYNTVEKPMKGTMVWERRSVVLDVAEDASMVSLGLISRGSGETWIDNISVEVVGKDVPVDVFARTRTLPLEPAL
ncbi:transcriptional regulator [Pseudoduganella aquatica]|uniref:transcriptional regulator n=1 Tax=Pseudoduganella aquatica TaxID=2660641 RepID=UPI001E5DABB4|nr:transcriptional regulator [Pseudoduganella aquatica]